MLFCFSIRAKLKAHFFLVVGIAVSGCAVNGHGFVRVDRFENETARVIAFHALGVHILTQPFDVGIVLGNSKRIYVFPKRRMRNTPIPINVDSEDFGKVLPVSDTSPIDERPVAISAIVHGLVVEANTHRFGFTLGRRSFQYLSVDTQHASVAHLKLNSSTPANTRAFFLMEER